MPKQFADQFLKGSWDEIVLLARWPRLWKHFPSPTWASQYCGRHDASDATGAATPAEELQAAANLLKKWAPTILSSCRPDSPELVEARADLEGRVIWLERASAATQPRQIDAGSATEHRLQRRPHSGRCWDSETVVQYFRAALLLRDASSLPLAVRLLSKASLAALASPAVDEHGGGILPVSAAPSGKTLMRYSFSVDACAILMARENAGQVFARYGWSDSSPQGGRDWLLSMVSECRQEPLEAPRNCNATHQGFKFARRGRP